MDVLIADQKAITATEIEDFRTQLQRAFSEGWRIVPGTIAIGITGASVGYDSNFGLSSRERYVAVVQK